MSVVNRETIIVHHNLAGALQDFSKSLFLDFTPSSVILRAITYGEGAGATDLHGVFAPWSNNTIATFIDDTNNGFVSNPGTSFKINNPGMLMNGDITFRVRRLNNTTSASTATGKLALTLEFIQEVEPEPKPVVADMSQLINYLKDSKESFYGLTTFKGGSIQYLEDEKVEPTVKNALDQSVNPVVDVHPDDTPEEEPVLEEEKSI